MKQKIAFWTCLALGLLLGSGLAYKQIQKYKSEAVALRAENSSLKTEQGLALVAIANTEELNSELVGDALAIKKALDAEVLAHGKLKALHEISVKGNTRGRIVYRDRIVEVTGEPIIIGGEEVLSIPYSYSDFRIDIEGDAIKQTLKYDLHQEFSLQLTELKKRNGDIETHVLLEELADKKRLKLEITEFQMLRKSPHQEEMDWLNPKLDISAALSINELKPIADIGISLSTKGKTEDDIRWRFFRIGVASNSKDYALTFSPAQYNLGKHLPLVDNVWLQPTIGKYLDGSKDLLMSIGIGGTL